MDVVAFKKFDNVDAIIHPVKVEYDVILDVNILGVNEFAQQVEEAYGAGGGIEFALQGEVTVSGVGENLDGGSWRFGAVDVGSVRVVDAVE